jgi:hypothetical protein
MEGGQLERGERQAYPREREWRSKGGEEKKERRKEEEDEDGGGREY